MELLLIRKEENLIEVETKGESHSFLNLLRAMLKDEPGVVFSAYRSKHPLLTSPIVYVRTSGEVDPLEAIIRASQHIIKACDEFEADFEEKAEVFRSD